MTHLISLLLFPLFALSNPDAIFQTNDHCVAWKTIKTLALIKTVKPVGKNCKIQTELKKQNDGNLTFSGIFPVKSFDSGERDRDEEVAEILNFKEHPNILFTTEPMSVIDWKKILKEKKGVLTGTMTVAGRKRLLKLPISVTSKNGKYKFNGLLITTYSNFRIEPPSVGGGLIAQAKDYLEFHFQFQSDRLKGFELVK